MSASDLTKPPRNTKRERMEAREATILAIATQIFAEQGVDGTRMADIARGAEVAEGTLYLYWRTKQDLLAAVVGDFWQRLTLGAEAAVDWEAAPTQQLRQLASYHLQALIEQFEVVALTYRARQRHGEPEFQLDQIRDYVRVFDRVMQRGIDLGEFHSPGPLWLNRDAFYGTLEFSARTLHLRGEPYDQRVVDNLLSMFLNRAACSDENAKSDEPSNRIEQRLARIETLLTKAGFD